MVEYVEAFVGCAARTFKLTTRSVYVDLLGKMGGEI